MSKKVINIVKKDKKDKLPDKSTELFNLNEEIIIGVNSKNAIKNEKTSKKKKNNSKSKKALNNKSNIKVKNNINSKNLNNKQKIKNTKEKKSHKVLKIFLIIFFILLVIVLLLLSPLFNIKTIIVKNNNKISKEEIISLSQIQLDDNIFKYINIKIMENIKENPYIEEVNIIRKYPSEIIIDVKERVLEYVLKINETYAYVNNQGYILEITNEKYELPEIIGYKTETKDIIPGNRLVEEDLNQLEKINLISNYAKENEIAGEILSYTIEEDKFSIRLKGEKVAYIKNLTNLNIKMLSLKNVLERTEGKSGEIFLDGQGEEKSILFRENV